MSTAENTFTVTETIEHTIARGWGVVVIPIHAGEDWTDPDAIVDLDVEIVRIDESTVDVRRGDPVVTLPGGLLVPVENFADDRTEEDGDRWFATHAEAIDYATESMRRGAAIRSWFE